ncbi:adenylate/guanylate cyclase domain-containing protein [Croceitalea rosinachiae]|uniref:Adenylate/guanylate cyclase domain-containing protein n=1 Tax=Croceitalea rosinachiae TaxID=3075596 RepID=A0ABU3AAC1_9FLAO|nr:adenylate/guanylate cyclase domain-containing protein [Croceitalea sp. F388]MDT0606855.1 adenylate/guanylate cyclase domain-containing protein [Croceitalea sp. F388]
MLAPKTKRYILKILPFGIITGVFYMVYALVEYGILGDHPIYPSTKNPYDFVLLVPTIVCSFLGLLIGAIEVLFLSKVFLKSTFTKKIIFKTLIYSLMIMAATVTISVVINSFELQVSPLSSTVWDGVYRFFTNFAFWSTICYFTLSTIACLFYSEISDNVGENVLLNFFTGKYHHPMEEERVFLFLDMKSSTTIAEQLGHITYFKLLRDYYADLSDAIITYGGEIYQYVGDEIVVTWQLKPNQKHTQSIECFFAMKAALEAKSQDYMAKYGLTPTFKAGIHLGKVTTGEIGNIKKDIVFTGDVLNTTARIQGLCNEYKVELLLSKDLIKALDPKSSYSVFELGETQLRGRDEKITLYSI